MPSGAQETIRGFAATGAKQALEPFEYQPGALAPGEVEVRVSHCGICHSDLAMIDNDWGMSAYPLVPGHEAIGTVTALGDGVDPAALAIGTRVGVGWQCGSCLRCEWCVRGLECLCSSEQDTIIRHHGGWADYVRCNWKFAVPIPASLDSADAGPLMCAGTTVFTPMLRYGVSPMMRAAVVGVGGLGHLAVQYLAAFGCEVTAISSTHSKDDEARRLGAKHFIATKGTSELKKAPGSFDFIISTVSADLPWGEYISALRPQGQLVLVGIPDSELKMQAFGLIGGERSVRGGRAGSPSDGARMLDFSARHGIKPMVERFALADVNAAVEHVRSGKARYRAVLAM